MRLPSGIDVKDETISGMADMIALDMLMFEQSYGDASSMIDEQLRDGYNAEGETLPVLHGKDRKTILEAVRVSTLEYVEKLRLARSELYDKMLKDKKW